MNVASVLPIILIVVVFYFLLVRPQRRRQQQMSATQGSLQVGAEVMLGSGIFGRVASLEDETVHLELSPGTMVKVARQAIVRVVVPDEVSDEVPGDELPAVPPEDLGHEPGAHDPEYPDDPDDPAQPGR